MSDLHVSREGDQYELTLGSHGAYFTVAVGTMQECLTHITRLSTLAFEMMAEAAAQGDCELIRML